MKRLTTAIVLAAFAIAALHTAAPAAPVGTAFTYQGKLDKSSVPANSTCTFQFSLFDALGGGNQIGATQTLSGITIVDGLFTVQLDFGAGAFAGQARWLQIAVQCSGDGGFTSLAPRQPVTPAPYAMYALSGTGGLTLPFLGTGSASGAIFSVENLATTNAAGLVGLATHSPSSGTGMVGKGNATGGYFEAMDNGGNGLLGLGKTTGTGVYGSSGTGSGVYGTSGGTGVYGLSTGATGVNGIGIDYGVHGSSDAGFGVFGEYGSCLGPPNGTNAGVWGNTCSTNNASAGVRGVAGLGRGVEGTSSLGDGVFGQTAGAFKSGSVGIATHANGYGGYFTNTAGGIALKAAGRAQVNVLEITGADLVEKFDANGETPEAGTVVVIDDRNPGAIRISGEPYDCKVAGVVSGAGGITAGIHLGQGSSLDGEFPIAMTGRVFVKCTTEGGGPIRPGDLLTSSSTAGHAMRAEPTRAVGAVIGKAMGRLDAGTGLVLVLVNLQ